MNMIKKDEQKKGQVGVITRLLAGCCHKCPMCSFVDKKPNSAVGKLMRWHRTWCPVWKAHTKVYGEKPLSQ